MRIAFVISLIGLLAMSIAVWGENRPGGSAGTEQKLLVLRNEKIVVGLLPRVGGTVALLRLPAGKNVLLSNPALWGEAEHDIPDPKNNPPYKAYNGQTVWVGPQETWGWPPDPYLLYGKFSVVEQSGTYVKMVGQASPICGLQLTKEVRLRDDGTVEFTVTGTNTLQQDVSWDLWSISRLPATARCYVPLQKDVRLKLEFSTWFPEEERQMAYRVLHGFLTFIPTPAKRFPHGINRELVKALVIPSEAVLAAFQDGNVFIKRTEHVPAERIHPSQSPVEMYQETNRVQDKEVLELEFHSAYQKFAPGQSMWLRETWQVLPYHGQMTPEAHIRFLQHLGIGIKSAQAE
ncbi:MAG TPA: DUF4380 domain-containing protein [Armatimonadota bacterium]|nr:DUF4380 domain-containing protein [Armatimonadota bacterium]